MINPNYQHAIFAGGCFWCMQPPYANIPGVISTTVGYTGGDVENPTYQQVSTGKTGHYEAVKIEFDSSIISYKKLVEEFWKNIDPTNELGQFADVGSQYLTAIFYINEDQKNIAEESKSNLTSSGKFTRPIVTEILTANTFYPGEEYHQDYYKKNASHYNRYKVGSGRSGFIDKIWGKEK
jgi:methionine-S-sulfoxide reductase